MNQPPPRISATPAALALLAEILVVAADAELACRVAHGGRAIATATRLVEHQRAVRADELVDQLERGICDKHPFDYERLT